MFLLSSRLRRRLLRSALASLIGWIALAGAGRAQASTLLQLSVEELCQRATLVVAATPLESTAVWEDRGDGRGRRIVTYTRVRVDRVIDGAAPAELWIRTLGGTIGDIGQRVDGEAVLAPGQSGVFFLRAFADGPHGVVGMAQGQYLLNRAAAAEAPRLLRMPMLPRLVADPAKRATTAQLDGATLEEASRIIRAAKQSQGQGHAP